jgi:hypothetical protein
MAASNAAAFAPAGFGWSGCFSGAGIGVHDGFHLPPMPDAPQERAAGRFITRDAGLLTSVNTENA